MVEFLTGPMLWLSLAVFVAGMVWRVIWYIKGLSWQLDRVAYGHFKDIGRAWAIKSIVYWLIPFRTKSWQANPVFTSLFFLFHFGLVLVPLFLFAHVMILKQAIGISWPTFPAGLSDALTILAIIGGLGILLRRFALPEVRIITTGQDLALLGLTLTVLVSGFVSAHQAGDGNGWMILHVIAGEVTLLIAPFTKLSHIVLFFCSRAQIGMDFGIKRGGMKGRGIVW
jgi:nitrate reductase gamma subunit